MSQNAWNHVSQSFKNSNFLGNGPPSKIVLLCNSQHLPCKYTSIHPPSLFSHLFYFIVTTLITSIKVPPDWSTQKELSHLGFLSTPASKRLPQKTDSKECYDLQYLYLCHTIYSMVYRKSGSVSSRKEWKFRQEHYICIKRRSVIPNRASCLLATRLKTISKVMFIFCSKALSFIHSVIRLSHIFGSFKTSFVS